MTIWREKIELNAVSDATAPQSFSVVKMRPEGWVVLGPWQDDGYGAYRRHVRDFGLRSDAEADALALADKLNATPEARELWELLVKP